MKNKSILFLITGFLLGSIPLLAVSFAEDENLIPSWIKSTAKFWVEGGVNDAEFINALKFMIQNEIIVVEDPRTVELENEINVLTSKIRDLEAKIEPTQNSQLSQIETGFSALNCRSEHGIVILTGKFTNGETPYSEVFFRMAVIGNDGTVLATGLGNVSNINAHQTRNFESAAFYDGDFKSCEIEISDTYR